MNIYVVDLPEEARGQGTGTRFMQVANKYCQDTGRRLVVSEVDNIPFFSRFPFLQYEKPQSFNERPRFTSKTGAVTCPTCGDQLGGQYGTFCPRCQWSEMDANLDSDPLSNPPDPTVDMHRGIQARTAGKLHDFLMNPKSRPDLQTPEAQAFLRDLERHYHNDTTDALMPWLTREWKKGRLKLDRDGLKWPGEAPPTPEINDPRYWPTLGPSRVNHWGDFLQSNHPVRRGLGDIMQHDIGSLHSQTQAWDEAMAAEAHEEALKGGQVVHTTPDNWTVRRLTTPQECSAEGDAMGHCVGGYGPAVERGDTLIYSLRDPKNSPHATAEIEPKYLEWRGQRIPMEHLDMNAPVDDGEDLGQPIPNKGQVVQIQGKGNQEPIDEHKARLADWFRSFPPEERPKLYDEDPEMIYDDDGYGHYEIDHPDLIPRYQEQNGGSLAHRTEPTEDAYGLLRHPFRRPADYDDLLKNINMREVDWNTTRGDPAHIKSIYLLAKERGEIPELAKALESYEEWQQESLDRWIDSNYEYAPRYPDPDDPHGWEDEDGMEADETGRPYWEPEGPQSIGADRYYDPTEAETAYDKAYGEWSGQHGGMDTANQMYKLINPHFNQQTQTWEPEPLPQQQPQPQTFSKWLDAVFDAP